MSAQQTLEKAIKKAIDNGFNFDHWRRRNGLAEGEKPNGDTETSLIFNHDFATALWGDSPKFVSRHIAKNGRQVTGQLVSNYEHHLQRMVIEKDPIKYLEANI